MRSGTHQKDAELRLAWDHSWNTSGEGNCFFLKPGSGADRPFSLPTSLNTGNSGAAGSPGPAGNFPTAEGGWECAALQRREGQPQS